MEIYSRKPVIQLPKSPVDDYEKHDRDGGMDELDRHVKQVLRKRDRLKRIALGVWSFLKTRWFLCIHIVEMC